MQVLAVQGGLTVLLLGFLAASWGDTQWMLVFAATALIPVGWSVAIYRAHVREERARRAGEWSKQWDAAERKRTFRLLGAFVLAAIALGAVALVLL